MKFAKDYNIPVTVIGNGSKLLVLDGGIRGLVIKLGSKFSNSMVDGEYITAEVGLSMPRLAIIAKDNSLAGLEFASGIPGYLGGGIFMNAGAYGGELGNVIEEVTYLDKNNEVKTLTRDELEFGYRTSYFKKHKEDGDIILENSKIQTFLCVAVFVSVASSVPGKVLRRHQCVCSPTSTSNC